MQAMLASQLRDLPDGTIYTVHNQQNQYLLPVGGFRIKKSSHLAREAAFKPNWYLGYLTIGIVPIVGHQFTIKQTEVQFDTSLAPGSTVFVWDDSDIKELQRLLRACIATSGEPDVNALDVTYDFTAPGLSIDTRTGRGEYNRHPFKLSPMQVKLLLALSKATARTIGLDQLVKEVGPDAADPYQAVKQLLKRTLKAMGTVLGRNDCPVIEMNGNYQPHYRWIGNLPRY